MLNLRSTFALALVALSAFFVTGCVGESEEPNGNVWYDKVQGICFTENEDGGAVEVPCEDFGAMPGLSEAADQGAGCTGTACCQTRYADPSFCP